MRTVRGIGLGLAGLLCASALSCAKERDPINRVQANALDKHFFAGPSLADPGDDPEFYWRNFVVDGSANGSGLGIGSYSGMDRIRWEITENLLVARKAYQIVKSQDDKGLPKRTPNGTVVAAFHILGHFDIKRDYNPQTGEELNVVVENTTDRPWYERGFMRVDWSTNMVDDPVWSDIFIGKMFGDLTIKPLAYYVNDPANEDAPHFEIEDGYFDVTNKFFVEPATTDSPFSDFSGKVPTCVVIGIYTGSGTYDCNAQEAVIRTSFWKIKPDHDYQPLENTTAYLDVVANFGGAGSSIQPSWVTSQQSWDPGYGYTDALFHRYAIRHNTWKQSHQAFACASNDDADANGTADACENGKTGYAGRNGSQCDVLVGKCTIPYRDRAIRSVGYWVNKETPADLLDAPGAARPAARGAMEDQIESWNQLMSTALAFAREVECRRTKDGTRDACHAEFFAGQEMVRYGAWLHDKAKDPTPVLTLCHNPVREYDVHEACGPTGTTARVGDVRKNFVFYWPYDSRAHWGGIGNPSADPLSGETIGASATIMGRSATMAAARQRDILQVAMGDLTVDDIAQNVPSSLYAKKLTNGYGPQSLSQAEIDRRLAMIDADHALQSIGPKPPSGDSVKAKLADLFAMQKHTTADPTILNDTQLEFDAIARPLRGSRWEADLVDRHWLVTAAAMDPSTKVTDAVLDRASPLRGLDSGRLEAWRNWMSARLASRGICFLDTEAPNVGSFVMPSLAAYFMKKYGDLSPKERGERIYHDLWIEAVKGIGIHEIGHSLSLRHQFASSYDAPNYMPQYWQLRTNEGTTTAPCAGPSSGGADTCMGPRYLDPETADEEGRGDEPRPEIAYFGNTSVMEYQIERFAETVGLGTYDQHAMDAVYGEVLQTLDDDGHGGFAKEDQKRFAGRLRTQLTEFDSVRRSIPSLGGESDWPTHYTEVARLLNVFDPARCRDATPEEKQLGGWRIVHGKVCAPAPKDHAAWRDFESGPTTAGQDSSYAPYWRTRENAPGGMGDQVRWWYRYGETYGSAYIHTSPFDSGADVYEATVAQARMFELSYPFSYFRRANREYDYRGIPASVASRYFERFRSYHWIIANSVAFYRTFGTAVFDLIASEEGWFRQHMMAETEIFNFFAKTITLPEPGNFGSMSSVTGPVGQTKKIYDAKSSGGGEFTIDILHGRYIEEDFNNDLGGSWDYLHWMNYTGFSTEKAYAARALADGRPTLFTIRRDNYLDGRNVKINFRNDMPRALDRLLGGILSEDWETVGSSFVPESPGQEATVAALPLADAAAKRPAGAKVLFPNVGYKQQLAATTFAAMFARMNTDMTLVNKMRIWVQGVDVTAGALPDKQQVRFYDPNSGFTYIARKWGADTIDGKTVDAGIASRMMAHANALLVKSYKVKYDASNKVVVDEFGTPQLDLDANELPQPLSGDASRIGDLTKYVGLLDAVRQIGHDLGYGPLGGTSHGGGGD